MANGLKYIRGTQVGTGQTGYHQLLIRQFAKQGLHQCTFPRTRPARDNNKPLPLMQAIAQIGQPAFMPGTGIVKTRIRH